MGRSSGGGGRSSGGKSAEKGWFKMPDKFTFDPRALQNGDSAIYRGNQVSVLEHRQNGYTLVFDKTSGATLFANTNQLEP